MLLLAAWLLPTRFLCLASDAKQPAGLVSFPRLKNLLGLPRKIDGKLGFTFTILYSIQRLRSWDWDTPKKIIGKSTQKHHPHISGIWSLLKFDSIHSDCRGDIASKKSIIQDRCLLTLQQFDERLFHSPRFIGISTEKGMIFSSHLQGFLGCRTAGWYLRMHQLCLKLIPRRTAAMVKVVCRGNNNLCWKRRPEVKTHSKLKLLKRSQYIRSQHFFSTFMPANVKFFSPFFFGSVKNVPKKRAPRISSRSCLCD